MRTKKNPIPKCIIPSCRIKASRWDGGVCGMVVKGGEMQPGKPVWLCVKHDPYHKSFDLPVSLDSAIEDLVALRAELQSVFVKEVSAEKEARSLASEVQMWRSLFLDKPEDRLWHDSDKTWWCRDDSTYLGVGGLFSAEPPKPIQKLMAENSKLKAQLARLKKAAQRKRNV